MDAWLGASLVVSLPVVWDQVPPDTNSYLTPTCGALWGWTVFSLADRGNNMRERINSTLEGGDAVRHTSRHGVPRGEKRAAECRIATLNVQGGMKAKIDEVCQVMNERRIDILSLSETKRKGKDVSQHGNLTAVWSGVPETERARQGVGVILSERLVYCMKEYECVSSRLLWIRLKIGLSKYFVLALYAPDMGSSELEREEFWENVEGILNKCGINEKIIIVGDCNGWVGTEREGLEGILGKYGDERINENGLSLLGVCVEKNLVVTNTMFDHKDIHKYTWERNGSKSLIDLVIVDRRLQRKVVDTRSYRGVSIGTDHYLVISRISGLFKYWRHRPQKSTTDLGRIKVEKLRELDVQERYLIELRDKTSHLWKEDYESEMKPLWETVKTALVEAATKVCGVAKRKDRMIEDNWWDDEVKEVVEEKKKAWMDLLAMRSNGNTNVLGNVDSSIKKAVCTYAEAKKRTKKVVEQKKESMKEKLDKKLSDDFKANIKLFWKQIRLARQTSGTSKLGMIRDEDGNILSDEREVLHRWKTHFENLFECSDQGIVEGADPTDLAHSKVDADDEITEEEIVNAMKGMKLGKAAGYDRISVEMLRSGKDVVAKLLWLLFNQCWGNSQVPEDWCKAVIVPLYKGKGSQQDCKNYRGISLLSVVGKLYAKVLIRRVMNETEDKMWDVQAGFRRGRGCMDQVFSLRCISEKHLAKSKKVFCAFIDLEKAYDRVRRDVLWSTLLHTYGVKGRLVRAFKSLYENSKACIRVNGTYSDWFNISRGVRQGCVASPWLFNLYMDNCLTVLKEIECGLRMDELHVKCLLYADDQVLLASSAGELQDMLNIVNEAFKENGMKINASKTKVMVIEREEIATSCSLMADDECIEQVNEFVYLGSMLTRDGKCNADIERRVTAGNKVNGALRAVMSSQALSQKARMAVHNGVLVPTLSYGSECWVWQKKHESRINAVEMRSLRSICGVTLADRMRNSDVRDLCKMKDGVVTKIERGMLRWFGHIERMDERRLTKGIYSANVSGRVGRGRPRRIFTDQINDILQKGQIRSTSNRRKCIRRCMNVKEAKEVCQNRSLWRSIVSAYPHGIQA